MKKIRFLKMHASGDDFMIIDVRKSSNFVTSPIAKFLGDRNIGVGFNQLAIIESCEDVDARLVFWNPNGTTLGACGSATRGVADLLMRERNSTRVVLRTERGLLSCDRFGADGVTVDMGPPITEWQRIPLSYECDTRRLPLPGSPTACSMGNPHCTFFVADMSTVDPAALGPEIEQNPLFPEKTNVHFVEVINRQTIRLRIWERGGGVPAGSGSCSSAAVVAAIRNQLTDHSVTVICDGGSVHVSWDGTSGVKLTGHTQTIFSGEAHLPTLY